ncbi:uncharacterized protein [Panulirus ornatus]|uniref:uncharacterized protein n=1 Tax=Panulirus ornatus TaxID=150431 RepID=UPI003A8B5DDA
MTLSLKIYYLLLPALALLHSGAEAQCSNIVITNHWQGNYQADFIASAPTAINGLELDWTFNLPVDGIDYWSGTVSQHDNTHFTLTDSNTNVGVGQEVKFSFQVHFSGEQPFVVMIVMNGVQICDAAITTPPPSVNPCPSTGMLPYDYSQALCMSYLFYEAQRSGLLPADQRVTWRGDSALTDGSDVGHDLAGGYYDAGDHVKFGFPMAFTATMLAWGLVDFSDGHEAAGQLEYGQTALRWATDYFLKAHTAVNELYGQVGQGQADHNYWGRPEDMTMQRPSMKIDVNAPGTELAAETAAALAAASMVFREVDREYSLEMLDQAQELYNFADNYREYYHNSITDANSFYHSWSGYGDELCWAALWLARATGDNNYLTHARSHWDEFGLGAKTVVQFSWDDKTAGAYALFSLLDSSVEYSNALNTYLSWLKNGATYTPEGLVFLDTWGANRHAANVAFLSLWAAKHGFDEDANRVWATQQMGQLLGDNPRYQSFVVGFGENPPQRPHHRSSSCPNPPADCSDGWALNQPGPNPHILYGALVGGPSQNGDYADDRNNFVQNEVACDYNAAFTGALAAMVELS